MPLGGVIPVLEIALAKLAPDHHNCIGAAPEGMQDVCSVYPTRAPDADEADPVRVLLPRGRGEVSSPVSSLPAGEQDDLATIRRRGNFRHLCFCHTNFQILFFPFD
jgi:hypothetical protein